MVKEMTTLDSEFVERRRNMAWWYACGRIDQLQAGDPSTDFRPTYHADRFASQEKGRAINYRTGAATMLPSIMDSWDRFYKDEMGMSREGQ